MKNNYMIDNRDISFITNYLKENDIRLLSKEEQYKLFIELEVGSKVAREKLILHNLPLVIAIANKYVGVGYSVLELFDMGCLGLIIAVDKFDYKRGLCFSTYAKFWIKQTILRSITSELRMQRLPDELSYKVLKMKKFISEYYSTNGYFPTNDEISKSLQLPIDKIDDYKILLNEIISLNMFLFNEEISEEEGKEEELINIIPSDIDYVEKVEQKVLNEIIRDLIFNSKIISDRNKQILMYHFGFIDGEQKTNEFIAKQFGISKSRVQQIEQDTFKKILALPKIQELNPKYASK